MLDYDKLAKEIDEFIDSLDTEYVNKWLKKRSEEKYVSGSLIKGKKEGFNDPGINDVKSEKSSENS